MLTFSGWGQPADALSHALQLPDAACFDYSQYAGLDAAIDALRGTRAGHVVAWSLGGQLALHAMARGALLADRLTLLGVPFQFVQSDDYTHAMDRFTFDTFRDNYARDAARTASRFQGLVAKGDSRFRQVMAGFRSHPHIEDTTRWLPWLHALDDAPVSAITLAGVPATTIIHGSNDGIVPLAQTQALQAAMPHATVEVWEGAAHAPHLHDAQRLRAALC
ncbi:MAG: hypothetical protein DI582_09010 [Azospirillum brasilense]|nr:MAG: hypothetical protein DI582_09010 [Azospirillum brasilense]